jgi:hypothetical protein
MLSYPGLIAGAMIFAIIIVQLRDQEYFSLIFIALFSIPLLGLLIFLSYKNLDLLGYILVIIPVILVWVGYRMGVKEPAPEPTPTPAPEPTPVPAEENNKEKCTCTRVPCVCPVKIT